MSEQYPIGAYIEQPFSSEQLDKWLTDIKYLPQDVEHILLNTDEVLYNTAYRENGWTVNEVIHHLADSHSNALIRLQLALTEDNPVIKPYLQDKWVKLPNVTLLPANISITHLHVIHLKLYTIFSNLTKEKWERTFTHPEYGYSKTIWYMLGSYVWHGKHHLAHIELAKNKIYPQQ